MNLFFIFLLGGVLGAGGVWVIMRKRAGELELDLKRTEKEMEEERTLFRSCELRTGMEESIASGFAEFNRKKQEIKEARKQEILKELEKRGKIKTNEVADLFEASRTTAFRYLEELEKEGKIEQVGAFGRNVEYKLKER